MEEVYKINPNIAWREIDGQILILDSQQNQMAHDLNEMGTFIFLSIAQNQKVSAIRQTLLETYSEHDSERIEKDLSAFLAELSRLDLIVK